MPCRDGLREGVLVVALVAKTAGGRLIDDDRGVRVQQRRRRAERGDAARRFRRSPRPCPRAESEQHQMAGLEDRADAWVMQCIGLGSTSSLKKCVVDAGPLGQRLDARVPEANEEPGSLGRCPSILPVRCRGSASTPPASAIASSYAAPAPETFSPVGQEHPPERHRAHTFAGSRPSGSTTVRWIVE